MAADQSAVAALVLSCQSAMDAYHSAEGGDGSKGNAKGGTGSKGKGKGKGKGKCKGKVKAKGQGKVAKGNGKDKDGSYKAGTYAWQHDREYRALMRAAMGIEDVEEPDPEGSYNSSTTGSRSNIHAWWSVFGPPEASQTFAWTNDPAHQDFQEPEPEG